MYAHTDDEEKNGFQVANQIVVVAAVPACLLAVGAEAACQTMRGRVGDECLQCDKVDRGLE